MRKTAFELLKSNPDDQTFLSWAELASIDDLKDMRGKLCVNHRWHPVVNQIIAIKLAENAKPVLWATLIAGAIDAIAAVVLLFR
jgi:hypothetical protein